MKNYLRLLRIHHWIKNFLIFLPLIFNGSLFDVPLFVKTVCGFFAFSLTASLLYIINDIADIDKDRNHPVKCKRPLAAGKISMKTAYCIAVLLSAAAACGCFYLITLPQALAANMILIGYFLMNIAYSHGLKDVPILDIVILVGGFVLRVLFGSAVTGIEISNWLYLTVFASCTYAALGKRRNELRIARLTAQDVDSPMTRNVLQFYNFAFLDKNMYVCLGLAITFYAMWSVDAKNAGTPLVWTVPLLIILGMKYSLNVENDSDGDPVEVILGDKVLLALAVLFAGILAGTLYL
ncbi:MAG: UbiA prenyltransferase family protein [Planctomycetaceae bacterium]|nr:UbiA prenyltransferase family protein [Planctomycetaceae bacterium]